MATAKWLWENVVEGAARDNAQETFTEGYTDADRRDHTEVWGYWVRRSAESIIESLVSERECSVYGVERPIGRRTAQALRKILQAAYGFGRQRDYVNMCPICGLRPRTGGYDGKCPPCWTETAIDGLPQEGA